MTNEWNVELLTFGYTRQTSSKYSLSYKFPKHLSHLIGRFYPRYSCFIENNASLIKVKNNAYQAQLLNGKFATIQFGDYFTNNDHFIYYATFQMTNVNPSHCGIGFITSNYDKWDHGDSYNTSNSDCVYLYGNGYYRTTVEFDQSLKGHETCIKYNWFDHGDLLKVKIDTKTKNAIIWNGEVDIDNLHGDELNYIWYVTLPITQTQGVALMFDMGFMAQIIEVVDQRFDYCYK